VQAILVAEPHAMSGASRLTQNHIYRQLGRYALALAKLNCTIRLKFACARWNA
jgi:hypothetical protein